jgi:hypothetical protein
VGLELIATIDRKCASSLGGVPMRSSADVPWSLSSTGLVVTAAVLGLSACSSSTTVVTGRRLQPACDEAVSHATTTSMKAAQGYARAGLGFRIDEVRGYLRTEGYRSTSVEKPRFSCKPYLLGVGLTRCTATARVCGR